MPMDNAPDYPTSAPQSKGNSAELFRSAQYAVLEPSRLPVPRLWSVASRCRFATATGHSAGRLRQRRKHLKLKRTVKYR